MELAGASVGHLPPYSPDSNPSEARGSKVKAILRALEARTAEVLLDAIGAALRAVTATDAESRFAHCGYRNAEELTALVSPITKTARNSVCWYAGGNLSRPFEFACHAWSKTKPIRHPVR
jgi:hypothetical protein